MNGVSIRTTFWRLLFLVLLIAVAYFSWKPNPSIVQVAWVPRAIGLWLDEHDFTKNFIGYGTLAFAILMAWAGPTAKAKERQRSPASSGRERKLLIGFCSLVVFLELGQLALRHRTCDWADILAGWLGGLLAWVLFRLTGVIKAKLV